MVNLFKREDEAEIEAEEVPESEEYDTAERLREEARARIENLVGLNLAIIEPTKLTERDEPTRFHTYLSKDFKLSRISEEDVRLIRLWVALINHLTVMRLPKVAALFHAELIAFLAAKSSVNGFERKMLVSAITRFEKAIGETEREKKKLI